MGAVILIIHLMVAVALVATVLLQRSEGGALGIGGGGGGGGGFLSGRGAANMLTRTTAILAAVLFVTSISLTLINNRSATPTSILDKASVSDKASPADALDKLIKLPAKPSAPSVPLSK